MNDLSQVAKQLVAPTKGILAADESTGTITKRLASVGLTSDPELNRKYRQMLLGTPEVEQYLSGVIMFDETVKQKSDDGLHFAEYLSKKGITPGIKVDEGKEPAADSPNESVTKGVDTLADRLRAYKELGLKFAKWRAELVITPSLPSTNVITENASRMAEYAKICQENGFVPIVEPEVVRDGPHDIKRNEEVTRQVLTATFSELEKKGVDLGGVLLKTNMVTSGKEYQPSSTPKEVAEATLRVLERTVPEELAGVVFLSGGQTPEEATANLNEINKAGLGMPWQMSFSFARALQEEALKIWAGKDENVSAAQEAFLNRLKLVSQARQGKL